MAEVTGPISTLPGARHALPPRAMCDDHPEREAVARVQGETDSMGSELHDLCQECVDALGPRSVWSGTCDWCKGEAEDLRNRRDFEEGMYGPVYEVCGPCVRAENQRLHDEQDDDEYFNQHDYYLDDDSD